MGNCNREIRVRGKHSFTDVRAKILYDCIFLRNFRILRSNNRNNFHTLLDEEKGIYLTFNGLFSYLDSWFSDSVFPTYSQWKSIVGTGQKFENLKQIHGKIL